MLLSPVAERNQDGLLSVLREQLGQQSHRELFALELGSGTGQHVVHFAQDLPFVTWQPSDIKEEFRHRLASLDSRRIGLLFRFVLFSVIAIFITLCRNL